MFTLVRAGVRNKSFKDMCDGREWRAWEGISHTWDRTYYFCGALRVLRAFVDDSRVFNLSITLQFAARLQGAVIVRWC